METREMYGAEPLACPFRHVGLGLGFKGLKLIVNIIGKLVNYRTELAPNCLRWSGCARPWQPRES